MRVYFCYWFLVIGLWERYAPFVNFDNKQINVDTGPWHVEQIVFQSEERSAVARPKYKKLNFYLFD